MFDFGAVLLVTALGIADGFIPTPWNTMFSGFPTSEEEATLPISELLWLLVSPRHPEPP
jgi:hypothetical protein